MGYLNSAILCKQDHLRIEMQTRLMSLLIRDQVHTTVLAGVNLET